jgi:hypothetical protein
MRIRSTKPEFWRSERIASVDWDARLVLKGLESFVDDNGVGKDDLELIVSDVFPRDLSRNPPGTLQKVSEAISSLAAAGLLWRYEVDGTRLLYIAFWERVQRIEKPSAGRFRRPDGTINYRESDIGASFQEPSGSTPVALRPGTGEQGNRGTGEKEVKTSPNGAAVGASFDEFWRAYPRKVGKDDAQRKFLEVVKKRATAQVVIDGARRLAEDPNLPDKQFIPHPATWLHRGGWTDEPLPAAVNSRTPEPARKWGYG